MDENLESLKNQLQDLINQRQNIDAEILKLRQRINALEHIQPPEFTHKTKTNNTDVEKYIGSNIVGKIGIIIAAIGIIAAIKILLSKDLLSDFGRVILGLVIAISMIFASWKNEKKRHKLSTILFIGGVIIFYSTSILAYNYYNVCQKQTAFCLMMSICFFSAIQGYKKNLETRFSLATTAAIIAPLCVDINNQQFIFAYLVVINLINLFFYNKKNWKKPFWTSLLTTPFLAILLNFEQIGNAVLTISIYTFFYISAIIITKKNQNLNYTFFLLAIIINSIEYYTIAEIKCLNNEYTTLSIGIINIIIFYINRYKIKNQNIVWKCAIVSAILFITDSISNWLKNDMLTFLITSEGIATLLVSKKTKQKDAKQFFEKLTLAIWLIISIISISNILEYINQCNHLITENEYHPFTNKYIRTTYFHILLTLTIAYLTETKKYKFLSIIAFSFLPIIIFSTEIYVYCDIQKFALQTISNYYEENQQISGQNFFYNLKTILILCLSLIYWPLWILIYNKGHNIFKILCITISIIFCVVGLYSLSQIRDSGYWNYTELLRYSSYIFLIFLYIVLYKTKNKNNKELNAIIEFSTILTAVWVSTAEIVNIFTLLGHPGEYKLWLSLHFGLCSLILIVIGLKKQLPAWRYYGFSILAADIIKIVFYDLWNNQLWVKALVFILLGALMLGVSYIYNKNKNEK